MKHRLPHILMAFALAAVLAGLCTHPTVMHAASRYWGLLTAGAPGPGQILPPIVTEARVPQLGDLYIVTELRGKDRVAVLSRVSLKETPE